MDILQIKNQDPDSCAAKLHADWKGFKRMLRGGSEQTDQFAEDFEMDELRESFAMFGELTIPEYQAAIKNAYLKERQEADNDPKYFPRLDFLKIRKQLQNAAGIARDKRNAHVNTLPAPTDRRQYCTPSEWISYELPNIWANFKAFGEWVIPPFWNKRIRGYHEGQEYAILLDRLQSHPAYTQEVAQQTADAACRNFVDGYRTSMRTQSIDTFALALESFTGSEKSREALKNRIDTYNKTNTIRKFAFDVDASWNRATAIAAFKAYGELVLDGRTQNIEKV